MVGNRAALAGLVIVGVLVLADGCQGADIGGRLLAAAEASAREWANHMLLLVTTDNAGARRFYERCGYHHVGDPPGLAVPALDEALYYKTLREHGERLPA